MKAHFATTPATAWIAFGTAIHATSSATRGWVDNVYGITRSITDGKSRYTIVAILLDATNFIISRREGCHLEAAALATACRTSKRTIDCHELSLGVHFLDLHLETKQ